MEDPDDVAIGARYVDTPGAIGRPVVSLTTGPTSPIVVHDGTTAIGVGFGADLRVTTPGRARTSYAVKVLPWLRAFRLERVLSTPANAFVETLHAPESVPQLGGVGETIEFEARCADSVLSIHVGDLHLGSFVDARYGFGALGLTADGYHGAGRVLIRSFAVHEVR